MAGRVFQDVMAGRIPGRARPAELHKVDEPPPLPPPSAPPVEPVTTPREEMERQMPTTPRRDPRRTLRMAMRADSVQSRFQALFATALSTKLTPRESAQFLDRFRYIVCTSNLLGEKMAPVGVEQRRRKVKRRLHDSGEDQSTWEARKVAKHWMGSGGCVLLVSLLVTWALQTTGKGSLVETRPRQTASLIVAMLTALYLYAQTRKAQTRLHYGQSITGLEGLVEHCHDFDTLACRIVQLIQEVELVARGYHLEGGVGASSKLPPISRLERHSEHRRCESLRRAVSSALNMALAATDRCFAAVMHVTQTRDLYKLADVYNVIVDDDQDDVAIMCDEHESIAGLRALLNRVHARRRCLLCSLLAVQADGRPGNARAWSIVAEQVRSLSTLYGSMAKTLGDVLEEDSKPLDLNQLVSAAQRHDPLQEKTRRHMQGVNQVGTALRRAQAKMCLIRDDSVRLLGESSQEEARSQLLSRYDSLGTDLEALLAEWREGKAWLDRAATTTKEHDQRPADTNDNVDENAEDVLEEVDTGSVRIRPDSLGFWGPRMSVGNFEDLRGGPTMPQYVGLEPAIEEVYEAGSQVGQVAAQSGGVTMSRADRIALMRKERELKQARTAQRQQEQRDRQSVVGELKDVLGHRQLVRQASLRMPPPPSSSQVPQGVNSLQSLRRPMGLRLSIHNAPRGFGPTAVPQTPDTMHRPPYVPHSLPAPGAIAGSGATQPHSAGAIMTTSDTTARGEGDRVTTAQRMAALMQESILSPPLDNGDRKVSTRSDTTQHTWDSALGGSLIESQNHAGGGGSTTGRSRPVHEAYGRF